MTEILQLTPGESLTVLNADAELLAVEATYSPAGAPPPAHFHPAQDERFEVLEGALRAEVAGVKRALAVGDVLEIPRGTAHKMWNRGDAAARVRCETRPAGRTLAWFRALDAAQRGDVGPNGRPRLPVMAALLTEYDDVFRLAAGGWAARAALRLIAPVGRRSGARLASIA